MREGESAHTHTHKPGPIILTWRNKKQYFSFIDVDGTYKECMHIEGGLLTIYEIPPFTPERMRKGM